MAYDFRVLYYNAVSGQLPGYHFSAQKRFTFRMADDPEVGNFALHCAVTHGLIPGKALPLDYRQLLNGLARHLRPEAFTKTARSSV